MTKATYRIDRYRFKLRMMERGETAKTLASKLPYSYTAVVHFIDGTAGRHDNPGIDFFMLMCKALDITNPLDYIHSDRRKPQ